MSLEPSMLDLDLLERVRELEAASRFWKRLSLVLVCALVLVLIGVGSVNLYLLHRASVEHDRASELEHQAREEQEQAERQQQLALKALEEARVRHAPD
jgi:hypothetical protein